MEAETLIHAIDQLSIDEQAYSDKETLYNKNEYILDEIQDWNRFFKPECLDETEHRLDQLVKNELVDFLKNYNIKKDDIPLSRLETQLHFDLANTQEILAALNSLWVIQSAFNEVRGLVNIGELASALASAETVGRKVEIFTTSYPHIKLVPELERECSSLTDEILRKTDEAWNDAIVFVQNDGSVLLSIAQAVDGISLGNLYETIQIADADKFHKSKRIEIFLDSLENLIFTPLLDKKMFGAAVVDGQLSLNRNINSEVSLTDLISSLRTTVKFLNDQLEESLLVIPIAKRFSHTLLTDLIRTVLPAYFPEDSSDLKEYSSQIIQAIDFEVFLNDIRWTKSSDVEQWTNNVNAEWILHRKNHHLDDLRHVFDKNLQIIEMEIQEQKENIPIANNIQTSELVAPKVQAEDNWDWNEEEEQKTSNEEKPPKDVNDNEWGDQDDWGEWDEDNNKNEQNEQRSETRGISELTEKPQGVAITKDRIIITMLPDAVLDCISRFIFEIEDLGESPRTTHLADLITLYRILAPKLYKNKAPSMIIMWNDMMQLYTKINSGLLKNVVPGELSLLKDQADLTLDQILQLQYREVSDILDQANRFTDCIDTENEPECRRTIIAVIEFIENQFNEWVKYASSVQTAQYTGELIEKAITRIMNEIEDKRDISEEESVDLSNMLSRIPDLEKLFPAPDLSITSSIAVYVPSWIKFQYFIEILQSSLADIDYLLTENSLVDFTASELENLVSALFAPSENRTSLMRKFAQSSRI